MNKFHELDVFIIDWWIKNSGISLIDISKHISERSIVKGEFVENFEEIMKRKMSFGEEHQKD